MRIFIKTTITLSVCLAVSSLAYARNWTMLNFQSGKCEATATSPADMDDYLRGKGMIPSISKYDGADGQVEKVLIKFNSANGTPTTLYFFTSMPACNKVRQSFIKSGDIIDKSDLR